MIGELHKNKGLEYAIEAVKNLEKVILVIIGEGEERERLQKIIDENNLKEKVFLLGFVKNASAYLPAFDTFILSSVKEGLPYVILEAGSAGLPVIASQVGGIPDLIIDGETGFLIPPKNSEVLAEKIKGLINNPSQRLKFGEKLKTKIISDFSLKQMADKTLKVYGFDDKI